MAMTISKLNPRRADRAPKVRCSCGEEYTLGVNGTVNGCDECTRTQRDLGGNVIELCMCYEKQGDNKDCPQHGDQNAHQ
jgi:hypothetical protein